MSVWSPRPSVWKPGSAPATPITPIPARPRPKPKPRREASEEEERPRTYYPGIPLAMYPRRRRRHYYHGVPLTMWPRREVYIPGIKLAVYPEKHEELVEIPVRSERGIPVSDQAVIEKGLGQIRGYEKILFTPSRLGMQYSTQLSQEALMHKARGEHHIGIAKSIGASGIAFLSGVYEGMASFLAPWVIAEGIATLVTRPHRVAESYVENPFNISRTLGGIVGGYLVGKAIGKIAGRIRGKQVERYIETRRVRSYEPTRYLVRRGRSRYVTERTIVRTRRYVHGAGQRLWASMRRAAKRRQVFYRARSEWHISIPRRESVMSTMKPLPIQEHPELFGYGGRAIEPSIRPTVSVPQGKSISVSPSSLSVSTGSSQQLLLEQPLTINVQRIVNIEKVVVKPRIAPSIKNIVSGTRKIVNTMVSRTRYVTVSRPVYRTFVTPVTRTVKRLVIKYSLKPSVIATSIPRATASLSPFSAIRSESKAKTGSMVKPELKPLTIQSIKPSLDTMLEYKPATPPMLALDQLVKPAYKPLLVEAGKPLAVEEPVFTRKPKILDIPSQPIRTRKTVKTGATKTTRSKRKKKEKTKQHKKTRKKHTSKLVYYEVLYPEIPLPKL